MEIWFFGLFSASSFFSSSTPQLINQQYLARMSDQKQQQQDGKRGNKPRRLARAKKLPPPPPSASSNLSTPTSPNLSDRKPAQPLSQRESEMHSHPVDQEEGTREPGSDFLQTQTVENLPRESSAFIQPSPPSTPPHTLQIQVNLFHSTMPDGMILIRYPGGSLKRLQGEIVVDDVLSVSATNPSPLDHLRR